MKLIASYDTGSSITPINKNIATEINQTTMKNIFRYIGVIQLSNSTVKVKLKIGNIEDILQTFVVKNNFRYIKI